MRRFLAVLAALLMTTALAACGDDDASDPTTAATTADSGDTSATTAGDSDDMTDDDSDDDMGDMSGGSYADITVDGTTVRFSAGEMTFSPFEGVQDITFEECDPSFFGAGVWVIAYPVDASGEMVMADEMNIGGILTAIFPFDDTPPDMMEFEFDVEHEAIGLDARYRAESGAFDYTIDGNRVTGTATLDQFGDPVDVSFDIVCAG